jgi:hypothetical protein
MKKYSFKISQKDYFFILEVKRKRDTKEDYDFHKLDNKVGKIGENIITQFLKQRGWKVVSSEMTHIDKTEYIKFDIRATKNGIEKRFEVKTDLLISPGNETGNLFMEIEHKGHKSGIIATTSDYYITILFFKREIWIGESPILRNLITHSNFRITKGGEYNKAIGSLLPRMLYKNYFITKEFGDVHSFDLEIENKNFISTSQYQAVN